MRVNSGSFGDEGRICDLLYDVPDPTGLAPVVKKAGICGATPFFSVCLHRCKAGGRQRRTQTQMRPVAKLARSYDIDARKFSPWSHTTAHIYGQLTRAVSLNDICDGLDLNSSGLRAIRGAMPPKRNTFSNAKDNMLYRTIRKIETTSHLSILRDEIIELTGLLTATNYPKELRLVEAVIEIDGKDVVMSFVSINLSWSAWTVAELYRAR